MRFRTILNCRLRESAASDACIARRRTGGKATRSTVIGLALFLLTMASALAADDPGRYAVLVGVSRYESPDLDLLRYPENDVVELAQVLRDSGFPASDVKLMTETNAAGSNNLKPTAANIRRELEGLVSRAKPNDMVVLAFAGHGVQYKGDPESYFCPADANLKDRATLLPIEEIYSDLEACQANVKLIFVDACRNELDPNTRTALSVLLERKTRAKQRMPPGGLAAFYSCSPGEVAYEDPKLANGVFFHFVVDGLRGQADLDDDKQITLPELEQFVKRQTATYVRDSVGGRQMPELFNRTRGLAPLTRWDRERAGWTNMQTIHVGELGPVPEGVPGPHYSIVRGIVPGTAVDRSGLKPGDIVLAIDGKPMDGLDEAGSISNTERTYRPGSVMEFEVLRDGERLTLSIESEPYPAEAEWTEMLRHQAEAGETWAMKLLGDQYAKGKGVLQDRAKAFEWYMRAAELGDSVAQNMVGVCYDTGRGILEDDRAAVDWYRMAARQGNWWGAHNLGLSYASGDGVEKDDEEALRWYRIAAERGLADAQNRVGLMYDGGRGVAEDDAEANRWYRMAADQGYATAYYNLGYNYRNGEGVEKNPLEAVKLFEKAAELGNTSAPYTLGRMYDSGKEIDEDAAMAVRWFRKAADGGHAAACWYLGLAYRNGEGVPKDVHQAVTWMRRGAERGDDDCVGALAIWYYDGTHVERDREQAARWALKIRDEEDSLRNLVLGLLYKDDDSPDYNSEEAFRCLRIAAEKNIKRAYLDLALCYNTGEGTDKDYEQATRWFKKGAEADNVLCAFGYATSLLKGRGCQKDLTAARTWYRKAADAGIDQAKIELGWMLASGTGGPKDTSGAVAMLLPVAEKGDVEAQYWLAGTFKLNQEYAQALEWAEMAAEQGDNNARALFFTTLTFCGEVAIDLNKAKAIRWLKAGADEGHAGCQYDLGWMYHNGTWVDEDPSLAAHWIRKSAEQNEGRACARLGWFYEVGRGVRKSRSEAIRWYRKGADQGNSYSKDRLKSLGIRE